MKRSLLFGFVLAIFMVSPAIAAVTIEEASDTECLINSGYSQALAEDVFVQKNRASGIPPEALYEKSDNFFIKCWRKLYSYADPAQEAPDRIHHDIKLAPHYTDL